MKKYIENLFFLHFFIGIKYIIINFAYTLEIMDISILNNLIYLLICGFQRWR